MYSCARLSLLFLGSLYVFLYQQVESSLFGPVHLLAPVKNTLSICPTGLTNNETSEEKLLSVMGKGSGLSFTVQIAEGASEITLDEPYTVSVQGDEVSVFQFIPPQGISDKQLDITATSQSQVAAYLKVSQNCEEVVIHKDLESVDYKKKSLRLSFATKGRITLSRVSISPLNDSVSRWFIGIGLKKLSGDVKLSESKNVTLKLTRSFDYNYATPICVLFFVSFVVGILVSIVAYYLFEESLTQVNPGEGNQVNDNPDSKVLVGEMYEVISYRLSYRGPLSYSYVTGIVGNILMVGAFQFVLAKWNTMIQEGDRDNCYYNDFCYRVAGYDIPFNLMISNLTYIVHGLILVGWVLIMETKWNFRRKIRAPANNPRLEEGIPNPEIFMEKEFSIGYALSWAVVFQGLFSALYHLCPNRVTFQFDIAFMFIISGLIVILMYNGIEQNPNPSSANVKYLIGASNFFLFFIVPLFIFNFLGALFNSDSGLNKVMQGFFFASVFIWLFIMVHWTLYELNLYTKIVRGNREDKCYAFLFLLGGLTMLCGIFMYSDLAQTFLFVCIACCGGAILAKSRPWKTLCRFNCAKDIFQQLFIFLTIIIFAAAFVVFKALPTTDKTLSPEKSRDKNKECVILGFFDWHDLWHFLSSFGLLMGAFAVMFISSEAE